MAQKNNQSIQRKRKIGEGTFGVVHIGSYLNRKEVAIKDIKGHLLDNAFQEAELLKRLTQQNIIQCYDIVQTPNEISIIMEFIDGGSLREYIRRTTESSMYWKTSKKILSDIAYGMAYLHSQNVIHADLKSINVLLRHDYTALICDFGLAQVIQDHQTVLTSSATGTVLWFAPELCFSRPERSSYASDVWAYGCIILEIASKKYPWIEDYPNSMVLLNALAKEENADLFKNICMKQPAPKKLRELLCQCCTWRKKDRPEFHRIVRELSSISEIDLDDIKQEKAKAASRKKETPNANETQSIPSCPSNPLPNDDVDASNTSQKKRQTKKPNETQSMPSCSSNLLTDGNVDASNTSQKKRQTKKPNETQSISSCPSNPLTNDDWGLSNTSYSLDELKLTNPMSADPRSEKIQRPGPSNSEETKIYDKEHDRELFIGPSGGQYYFSKSGKKVYVKGGKDA